MKSRHAGLAAAALVSLLGLALLASGPAEALRVGSALFGRPFVASDAVVKNGERAPLVEGTRLRLRFVRGEERDLAQWRAGCNNFGARVEITATRLEIGQVTGTEVGCDPPLARQDRWVSRFFASDPEWVRHGNKLRLTRRDDVIRLRRPDADDRRYAGKIRAGGAPVVLRIERENGSSFFRRFTVRGLMVPCSDGSERTVRRSVRDRVRLDADGHFRSQGFRGDRDDGRLVRLAGTVRERRAEGRFQLFKEIDHGVCETRRLSWSASR
jgi:hypothetical protein